MFIAFLTPRAPIPLTLAFSEGRAAFAPASTCTPIALFLHLWRWRYCLIPKLRYQRTKVHDIKSQKTINLTRQAMYV